MLISNLPQDIILECPGIVNKEGVHGVKWGKMPKSIAAILRIEATVQDLCVDAILNKSKQQAITALAVDPNVGSFEMADKIFNEMQEKYDKAESSFLKNEYKRSIVQHEKHKKSLVELLNHKEVINLRLNSSLNLLKQLKLDTVRIKTISDINEPFAVKELNQKTEELSQYLEDFQEGINHLALEM